MVAKEKEQEQYLIDMNDKETALYNIVDIVVACCATEIAEGVMSLTRDDVLGSSRNENVCMTRTILVNQLLWAGFSVTTVATLLNKTTHAVRHIQRKHDDYVKSSRAYRIADSEATIRCRDIEAHGL